MKEQKICGKLIVTVWKNFVKDIYINHIIKGNKQIGGQDIIVQVDESIIYKWKYVVGQNLGNQDLWIVDGVDERGGIYLELTTRHDRQTLRENIWRKIASGFNW